MIVALVDALAVAALERAVSRGTLRGVHHADARSGRFTIDGYPPPCGLSDGHLEPCAGSSR